MIRCDRCRTDNPAGAQFCMKCGAPLQTPSIPAPHSSKAALWIALSGAILIILSFGIAASGVLRSIGNAPKPGVLSTRADAPPPNLLQVEAEPKTGVLKREQSGMPPDIRAWLEHLERVERERRSLSLHQIGSFTVTMTSLQVAGVTDALKDLMSDPNAPETQAPTSGDKVHEQVREAKESWRKLREKLDSVPPPAECVPIRDQYEIALRETSGMMIDLLSALDRAMSSESAEDKQKIVGELYAMKGTSETIDRAGGATDGLVGDICAKYETRKWFDIARDIGGGGMMGMPGF